MITMMVSPTLIAAITSMMNMHKQGIGLEERK